MNSARIRILRQNRFGFTVRNKISKINRTVITRKINVSPKFRRRCLPHIDEQSMNSDEKSQNLSKNPIKRRNQSVELLDRNSETIIIEHKFQSDSTRLKNEKSGCEFLERESE